MRVFISSTYRDLLPERQALTWVVQELRATFVGMEIFSAAQESPTDAAIREISECDVVVFVIAHRYGSLARASKKSILEREYETACSQKKHIFIYVKDEGASVHVADIEFENRRKLLKLTAFSEPDGVTTVPTMSYVASPVFEKLLRAWHHGGA